MLWFQFPRKRTNSNGIYGRNPCRGRSTIIHADMTPTVNWTSSVVIGILGAVETRVYVKGEKHSYFQFFLVIAAEISIVLLHVPSLS